MPETFIPGWQTTVTIGSEDVTAIGQVLNLNLRRNIMNKPVFGSGSARSLGGQRSGTFSASGHVAAELQAALVGLFESDAPVAFTIQVGLAGTATDGGAYAGDCNIESFEISVNADGEWEWSMSAMTDGTVDYTPAA